MATALDVIVVNREELFENPIAIDQSAPGVTNGVVEMGAMNGTNVAVASLASSQLLLRPNMARKGGMIANNSTALLYVLCGDGPASTARYSFVLGVGSTVPTSQALPAGYRGAVHGIWASANGSAYVSEFF